MHWLKTTFFYRLYKLNRGLFYLFFFFFSLTLTFNLFGDQITPFFVFGMYSEKETEQEKYEVLQIIINDSIDLAKHDFSLYQKHFVQDPLRYYKAIKENGDIDPTLTFLKRKLKNHYPYIQPIANKVFNSSKELKNFMPWFQQYLQSLLDFPVTSITVNIINTHYTKDQKVSVDTVFLLEKWRAKDEG